MKGHNSLRKAIESSAGRKEDRRKYYSGLLGTLHNGKNIVEVAGRHGYVWVRLRNQANELIQALNDTVSNIYGLPVLVERDEFSPNRYRISGRDIGRYSDWGTDSSYLPKHGNQHSFTDDNSGGGDISWIYSRQLMPFASSPSGTAGSGNLIIEPCVYYYQGEIRYAGGTGTPDILAYLPTGSFARMVLVYINDHGNPTLRAGNYFPISVTDIASLLGYLPSYDDTSEIALAGVRIASGTTSIDWTNVTDLRPWIRGAIGVATGTTPGTGVDSLAELDDVTIGSPSDGDVLTYDQATAKWIDAPPPAAGTGSSGASNLADLDDVNIPSPSNGDVLTFNSATSKWVDSPPATGTVSSLDDLTDISFSAGISDGDVLTFSTALGKWTDGPAPTGSSVVGETDILAVQVFS